MKKIILDKQSNDSEEIATLIEKLKYEKERTEEVLKKYRTLHEKTLSLKKSK